MQSLLMGKREVIRLLDLSPQRAVEAELGHLLLEAIPSASQADLAAAQEDREPQQLAVLAHQAKVTMVAQTLVLTMGLAAVVAQVNQAKIGKALGQATAAMASLLHLLGGTALLR
jgi:hypothetical protein